MIKDSCFTRIKGFEDYGIDKKGNVYSFKNGKVLRQGKTHKGYLQVCFTVNGKKVTKRVHRLVAEAFLPKENGKEQVNHKDGNKTNNNVDNLEWCTNSENLKHAYRVLGIENKGGGGGKTEVCCVETGCCYNSISEASEKTGIYIANISRACKKGYTAGGYHWKYINGGRKYEH